MPNSICACTLPHTCCKSPERALSHECLVKFVALWNHPVLYKKNSVDSRCFDEKLPGYTLALNEDFSFEQAICNKLKFSKYYVSIVKEWITANEYIIQCLL